MVTTNHVPRVSTARSHLLTRGRLAHPACGPLAGLRVLVVHGSPDITGALADVFTGAGARVAVAHEGSEANVLLAWGGHDLVVLDAAVPGATDVLDLVAEHRPKLLPRTIVLTCDVSDAGMKSRLRASYPGASFHGSWLVDLVGVAARATAAPQRRAVA